MSQMLDYHRALDDAARDTVARWQQAGTPPEEIRASVEECGQDPERMPFAAHLATALRLAGLDNAVWRPRVPR